MSDGAVVVGALEPVPTNLLGIVTRTRSVTANQPRLIFSQQYFAPTVFWITAKVSPVWAPATTGLLVEGDSRIFIELLMCAVSPSKQVGCPALTADGSAAIGRIAESKISHIYLRIMIYFKSNR